MQESQFDFIVNSSSRNENRAIRISYKKNEKVETRVLYVRELNASLAYRLAEIEERREEILNEGNKDNFKNLRKIYDLFYKFLEIAIENFDENKDLIDDLPLSESFISEFQKKIVEKLTSSGNTQDMPLKKKTRDSYKKK